MTISSRRFVVVLFSFALFLGSCEDAPPELTTPVVPAPAPENLTVRGGQGIVTVSWTLPAGATYSAFVVSRSEDGGGFADRSTVAASPFIDSTVRDGVVYAYRVAGIDSDGLRGDASAPATIRVAAYAVLVEDDARVTGTPTVRVGFTAPAGTRNVRVSTDSLMAGVSWRDYVPAILFTLDPTDGVHRVYAQFIDETGNRTDAVFDDIILDTFADISSPLFSCLSACVNGDTVSPGATVHLHVNTVGNEAGGSVDVFIEGLGESPVALRDDGTLGDAVPGDGSYETDYTFASFFRQKSMRLSAVFRDEAGNESPEREFANTLYMSDPPTPVYLFPVVDSSATSVTLRWTRSTDAHFARYEIYRSRSLPVDLASAIRAGTVSQSVTNTFNDVAISDSTAYYYRVFVVNDLDEPAGSQTRGVAALRP